MITKKPLDDDRIILNPGKTLDNNNAHEMADTITEAHAAGYRFVILNVSELEFLASVGVGSILGAIEMFREKGGDIILCNVSEKIIHILDVLDLTEYLTIKVDEQAANEYCLVKG